MKNSEQKRVYRDFVGQLTATYKRTSKPTIKIKSSNDAANFMRDYFDECMDDHEEVKVLHLNRANYVVNVHEVSSGSDTGSMIPIKLILRNAILISTSCIIIFHNHPSSNLNPSEADKKITQKLKKACELLEIQLFDHIILTREDYFSFADNDLM